MKKSLFTKLKITNRFQKILSLYNIFNGKQMFYYASHLFSVRKRISSRLLLRKARPEAPSDCISLSFRFICELLLLAECLCSVLVGFRKLQRWIRFCPEPTRCSPSPWASWRCSPSAASSPPPSRIGGSRWTSVCPESCCERTQIQKTLT